MRSVLAGLRSLVLPWGTPADSPAIVAGPDVPPELVAYFQGIDPSTTVVAVIIFRYTDTAYTFDALLSGPTTARVIGVVDTTASPIAAITLQSYYTAAAPANVQLGDAALRGTAAKIDAFNKVEFWDDGLLANGPAVFNQGVSLAGPTVASSTLKDSAGQSFGKCATGSTTLGPFSSATTIGSAVLPLVGGPYVNPPTVLTNIDSSSGDIIGWVSRAYNVTATTLQIGVTHVGTASWLAANRIRWVEISNDAN